MVFLEVEKVGVKLKVKFFTKDGNEFRRTVARIKNLRGARFDSTFKCWFVEDCNDNIVSLTSMGVWKDSKPNTKENLEISRKMNPVFAQCPESFKEFVMAPEFVPAYDVKERQKKLIESVELKGNVLPALRNYQKDFLKFMDVRGGRAILADDMGTGKTLQSLAWLAYSESFPALIVVTAPTKLQWEREYGRWLEGVPDSQPVEVLSGRTARKLYAGSTIIINWDILHDWTPVLLKYGFKCIIGDEAQAIGNPESKRAKAFLKLAKKIPQCIVMSGTPARSRPAQYWSMISCVEPELFPKYKAYLWRYCDPKISQFSFGPTFDGSSNAKELHSKLMKCMLRRTKDEIMTELPKKQVEVIPLEVDESVKAQYDTELSTLDESAPRSQLELKVMSIVRCAYMLKQKSFLRWVKELVDITGEKVVVFCWHRDVVDLIEEGLNDLHPAKIYGGMSLKEREAQKTKFIENDSCKVIIGNIQALGTGVDGLQKVCCKAIFAEFSNTITDSLQAEDRLHRGGQERQVTIYYTCAKNTIDEDMMKALDDKRKVLDSVLNGKDTEETDLLSCIIKRKRAN